MANRTVTCGDCIHTDICKQLNGGWFSRENIAYCKAFKDRTDVVDVVRCKDCKHYREGFCFHENWWNDDGFTDVGETDFCSYGERREGE